MALNFGKANRSIAFDPTSAFPLDARSYFEKLSDAEAAAASAKEVGSTDSVYYYGQTLAVVENNIATLYIIQPDQTLTLLGGDLESSSIQIDSKQFVFENGVLSLQNFQLAQAGQMLTVGSDGTLTWVTPDTYTKTEINDRLAALGHLNRIITSLEEIETIYLNADDFNQYIFMVPKGFEENDDKYDEYIILEEIDSEGIKVRYIEKVGSWEVDLKDYVKQVDLEKSYVKQEPEARLITNQEIEQFSQGERNFIASTTDEFIVDLSRQLSVKQIPISKITGLSDALDNKISKQDGFGLISKEDQDKLKLLQINEDNNLEISSTVHADNIKGLEDWISRRANSLVGLSQNNISNELYTQLTQQVYIKSVNSTEFNVANNHLEINKVPLLKVEGLKEALDLKASSITVENIQHSMTSFQTDLNNSITRIENLESSLVWKDL